MQLKKQEGGTMEGGALYFPNTRKYYILAKITDQNILNRLNERRAVLLKNAPPADDLHVTLLQFEINSQHPNANIFDDPAFHRAIRGFYDDKIAGISPRAAAGATSHSLILQYMRKKYDLLGQGLNKFFVKVYAPSNSYAITHFRTEFYNYLDRALGNSVMRDDTVKNYKVLNYRGVDLIAIPKFYYGPGVWKPHISILNTGELKTYNPALYSEFANKTNTDDQIKVLLGPIEKSGFGPIGNIDMRKDITSLIISLTNPYQTYTI